MRSAASQLFLHERNGIVISGGQDLRHLPTAGPAKGNVEQIRAEAVRDWNSAFSVVILQRLIGSPSFRAA